MSKIERRKIIHIDMDAFYASVEQRDNPDLRGKPIAVGGGEHRGVTTTASYEARKFGVRSAMVGWQAKKLCPQLIFVAPRFAVYKEVSKQVRSIFHDYTDVIEPLSLDEAFLDVAHNKKNIPYAMDVAKEIMGRVEQEVGLTCSAGVSYCKFLAKIASGYKKPNGLTIITPKHAQQFIESLEVSKFFGVGKVTAKKMAAFGIHTGADLKQFSKLDLAQKFGKSGSFYFDIVRGIDNRPVVANRVRKSWGVERTLEKDLEGYEEVAPILEQILQKLFDGLSREDNFGRTITLKVKTYDFKSFTRSKSSDHYIKDFKELESIAFALLKEHLDFFGKIRLIGLTASNLEKEKELGLQTQLTLDFEDIK